MNKGEDLYKFTQTHIVATIYYINAGIKND